MSPFGLRRRADAVDPEPFHGSGVDNRPLTLKHSPRPLRRFPFAISV